MTKLGMRRAWFQVHKWIGIVLAILIIPLSLSGAALVWDEALARVLTPQRFAVSGATLLDPQAYVAAATPRLKPGERIAQLTLPQEGGPVIVAAAGPGAAVQRPGPPQRTMIYLDPPTARVLDVASSASGVIRFLHVLHGSLQIPGVGRTIVGWIGVAMLLSSFTGLWLWWPSVGRWTRGLRWRRHRNTDTNLHHLFGFWIALPLFVLSLTGAWIAFPGFFAALSGQGQRSGQARGPERGAQARARPVASTTVPVDDAVAAARAMAPGDVRSITWPTEKKADWSIQLAGRDAVTISVADDSGTAALAPERGGQGGVARLMRRLHDGTGMGPVWQAVIFLGGILPAVLAVTGLVMWWHGRRWRDRKVRPAVVVG